MRHIATAAVLSAVGLVGTAATTHASTTPPDTTIPEASQPVDTLTAVVEPAGDERVTVVDESGNPLAAITVSNVETAWSDFAEGDEPESGHEYLRVTVVVESQSPRGLVAVASDDFILQDADGFVTVASDVPTAEQSAAEQEPVSEAELASGETIELALTFEIVSGVAPQAMYYQPSSERLVTVTELG